MQVTPDCLSCLLRQAIHTLRCSGADEQQQMAVLREVLAHLAQVEPTMDPSRVAEPMYETIVRITGKADPYAAAKKEANTLANELLGAVRDRVTQSHDPLAKALQAAAAGCVIDAGVSHQTRIRRELKRLLEATMAINDTALLRNFLKRGARVLYVLDNAGEIVLDALVVDRLQRFGLSGVTVAVKSGPIVNDATLEDARAAGLPKICTVIETGAACLGVDWSRVSAEFRDAFRTADAVIAKGHAHFETLHDDPHPGLFFLLYAKCAPVARSLRCPVGSMVFAHAPRWRAAPPATTAARDSRQR